MTRPNFYPSRAPHPSISYLSVVSRIRAPTTPSKSSLRAENCTRSACLRRNYSPIKRDPDSLLKIFFFNFSTDTACPFEIFTFDTLRAYGLRCYGFENRTAVSLEESTDVRSVGGRLVRMRLKEVFGKISKKSGKKANSTATMERSRIRIRLRCEKKIDISAKLEINKTSKLLIIAVKVHCLVI